MVGRDIPVNLASRVIPPRPTASAFSATYRRAWYSFRVPSTRSQRFSAAEIDPSRSMTLLSCVATLELLVPIPVRLTEGIVNIALETPIERRVANKGTDGEEVPGLVRLFDFVADL
jgi:hypothetical protein